MEINLKTLFVATVLALSAKGQPPVTLVMDEVANQSIDGLVVNKGGINFAFSMVNPLATPLRYDSSGFPPLTFLQGAVIAGSNADFRVAFSVPVSAVQFGLAVGGGPIPAIPIATMVTVSLFNINGVQIGTAIPLGSSLTVTLPEGQFTYNGALGPVSSMLISTPGAGVTFTQLAFDNLKVTPVATTPPSTVPAATPLTLALIAIGLAGLTMLLPRKRPA